VGGKRQKIARCGAGGGYAGNKIRNDQTTATTHAENRCETGYDRRQSVAYQVDYTIVRKPVRAHRTTTRQPHPLQDGQLVFLSSQFRRVNQEIKSLKKADAAPSGFFYARFFSVDIRSCAIMSHTSRAQLSRSAAGPCGISASGKAK